MKSVKLRPLLWVDCSGAAVVGIAMLALSGLLAPPFGLPRAVLVFTALVNLAYGAFSFSLARQPAPPRRWVKVLVVANLSWAAVCGVTTLYFAAPASWMGASYLLGEGIYVAILATLEARALKES